ncbi:phosphotransferase family protein [Oceaniglobus trochenteri]|uniref:phosphotransferase family protein n=1 Tax=Oceaniglobus trochenteri TaxID=2763260 RepID=UPI001CFF8C77
MAKELEERCRRLVGELGLGAPEAVSAVVPLTGGVASDIARVDLDGRRYCVKFALAKLKVAEDWRAPVHRNKAEYDWLCVADKVAPGSVPALHGRSESENGFAMEFLDGAGVRLWKADLLTETPRPEDAMAVGDVLGRIHAASTTKGFDRTPFHNRDDFRALRIDPYLGFTATRHPELAARLGTLSDMLYAADQVLIHGDISPKNILFRVSVPILLDAECATMGDPCFDVAFCLNHLVLKSLHRPEWRDRLIDMARRFWAAYAAHVTWETRGDLDQRVAALLPALMLARVDGKSPVEYLDAGAQDRVRALAIPAIRTPPETLSALLDTLQKTEAT